MIDTNDPAAVRAEAERRAKLREKGARTFGAPDSVSAAVDARALEKQIERAGDVLMQQLGFEVIKFSHPGKTQQTPGIPDRRYYRRPRIVERIDGRFWTPPLAVWVEYKSATGSQRPGQKLFEEMVVACDEHYVLGGIAELRAWLVAQGITDG